MKTSTVQRRKNEQQNLFGTTAVVLPEGDACHIVSVGKRRDGGTRYWCLKHRADATKRLRRYATSCTNTAALRSRSSVAGGRN